MFRFQLYSRNPDFELCGCCSWALGRSMATQEAIDEWEGRGTGQAGGPLSSTPRHVHGVSPLMHTLAYRAKNHLANRHRWVHSRLSHSALLGFAK